MRLALAAVLMLAAAPALAAGTPAPPPACTGPEFRQLDFWLGDWDVSGPGGGGANHITKSMDGCVIEERFDGRPNQHLVGHSVSTYFTPTKDWRQTWVDNEGGYLDMRGGLQANGDFVLATERRPSGNVSRMVFTDIKQDSFTWRWQASTDGVSWKDSWVIQYTRQKA